MSLDVLPNLFLNGPRLVVEGWLSVIERWLVADRLVAIGSFSVPWHWLLASLAVIAVIAGVTVAVLLLRSKVTVTLNIEGTSARFLITKGNRILRWGSVPLDPEFIKDGLILDPSALGTPINFFFTSYGMSRKKVIASLTGLHSVTRILSLPPIPQHLQDEAILRELKKAMPVPLEELYLSWHDMGGKEDEKQIFALGVPRSILDNQVQTLLAAEIMPCIMELKPMALVRSINRKEALIFNIEPDSIDIIVVVDAIPVIMRTITVPERIATAAERVQYLMEEVNRTVRFYDSSHPMGRLDPATPVFITGELADDPAIVELVQANIKYPIESLVSSLEYPPAFPVSQYAVNIGLALKQKSLLERLRTAPDSRAIDLNILPETHRPRRLPARLMLSLAAPIIISAALLLPIYQLESEAVAETARLQTRTNVLSRELTLRRLTVTQTGGLEAVIAQLREQAQNIEQEHQAILSSGRGFVDALQLVRQTLPSGGALESIGDAGTNITLAGTVPSYQAALDYVDALKQTGQFSTVDITRMEQGDSVAFTIIVSK